MRRLIMALKKGDGYLPLGFKEVSLSRQLGWDYWTIVSQPNWFLEKYLLYAQAENAVNKIKEQEIKAKQSLRK